MGINKLTAVQIKNAKPRDKSYTLSDGMNLQLLVKPNGSKIWEVYYQSPTKKKRRRTSIGAYPIIRIVDARKKRDEFLRLVYDGIDPIDYYKKLRQEKTQNLSFKNVVSEWLKTQNERVKNKRIVKKTYQRIESLMINDAVPYLKDINIEDITENDIVKIIKKKNKTAPVSAERLLQYLNKLWVYAKKVKYCKDNVVSSIDKSDCISKTKVKHYARIVDIAILGELIDAIYGYNGHISTKNAMKFVLHVPLRVGNLVNLQWKQINFDEKILTIPREEMKISDKGEDFILPLSSEVIDILEEQKRYTGTRKYIFSGDKGTHISNETINRALQRLGFNDEKRGRRQRTHSFRGTFRALIDTYQKKHNATFEVKELALDHTVGNEVSNAYTGGANYLPQLRELMDWWSGFVVNF